MSSPRAYNSKHAPRLHSEDIRRILVQYHQTLLGLEADLKEGLRLGQISLRVYTKRAERLKEGYRRLHRLEQAYQGTFASKIRVDTVLPLPPHPSAAERGILNQALRDGTASAEYFLSELQVVYRWLVQAISKRSMTLTLVLRLSKLRGMLSKLEKRGSLLEEYGRSLTVQIGRLLNGETPGPAVPRPTLPPALRGLITLFESTDALSTSVARLKHAVRQGDREVEAMRHWLKSQYDQVAIIADKENRPSPLAVRETSMMMDSTASLWARAKAKKHLIEAYWQDVALHHRPEMAATRVADVVQKCEEEMPPPHSPGPRRRRKGPIKEAHS